MITTEKQLKKAFLLRSNTIRNFCFGWPGDIHISVDQARLHAAVRDFARFCVNTKSSTTVTGGELEA